MRCVPIIYRRFIKGVYYMTNEMFYELLKEMKAEGITHKEIAEGINIPIKTLYDYIYRRRFSADIKQRIINYLKEKDSLMYQTITDRIKMRYNEK